MKRKVWILLCLCSVLFLPWVFRYLRACSINSYPVFSMRRHPGYPVLIFARGNLGVVESTYFTPYLFIAYRHLSGRPFSGEELETLRPLWPRSSWEGEFPSRIDSDTSWDMESRKGELVGGIYPVSYYKPDTEGKTQPAVSEWLEERSRVTGHEADPGIEIYREKYYSSYMVYSASSFRTAARTLRQLIEDYGPDDPNVREWVNGQDLVYGISQNPALRPFPLPEGAPRLFQQHRAYQTAAALFYAEKFDEAIEAFEAVSRDEDSPWRDWGGYLVARCLIRKASLLPVFTPDYNKPLDYSRLRAIRVEEEQKRAAILQQAETHLRSILASEQNTDVRRAAGQSLSLVLYRSTPVERLIELSGRLTNTKSAFKEQELIDGLRLLMNAGPDLARQVRDHSEMIDWIFCFRGNSAGEPERALKKWHEIPDSLPWLVAALRYASVETTGLEELLARAETVQPDSPAYATVLYHRARILACKNRHAEAASLLDSLLAIQGNQALNDSSRNRVQDLRMQQARSLDEFVDFLPRHLLGYSDDSDGSEFLYAAPSSETKAPEIHNLLDPETLSALPLLPLDRLRDICLRSDLSSSLQTELAIRTWSRAVLMERWNIAREISPVVTRAIPALKADVDLFVKAGTDKARRFGATLMMLRESRLVPEFVESFQISSETDTFKELDARFRYSFPFLTPDARQTAEAEYRTLYAGWPWANRFCEVALEWAGDDPNDPRVPEALHLAVAGTRHATLYSKSNDETGTLSRKCFQLLHKRYPDSPWTAKTPYWYK
jgi:tetratricopeptide (TPR) repeat protein